MEKRIIQLETLSTLQDETIAKLGEELFRQQQDIARLHQRIQALEDKIEQLGNADSIAGNEKPPHW